MLFDSYDQKQLLININFKSAADAPDTFAYRGELVLIEGEVGDAQGRKKPPLAVMRNAVMLSKADKLQFICGCLDNLDLLPILVEKYEADFAADMGALLFVVDITAPLQVELAGVNFVLIPLIEGIAWNELIDELCLEKGDFKGQSAGQKVVTAWQAFRDYAPKGKAVSIDEAAAYTAELKREGYGAV